MAEATAPEIASELCPRCSKKLTDPNGLGWCPGCGYCKSLEQDKALVQDEKPRTPGKAASLGGLVQASQAVGGLPRWAWIMVLGMALFAGFSFLPALQLRPDSLERALWSSLQIGFGLVIMFVGQLYALFIIAPEDEKISFKDAILPFRLYGLVFKRLPYLALPMWLGAWGSTLILSAILIIGGLPFWLNYLPGQKNAAKNTATQKARR